MAFRNHITLNVIKYPKKDNITETDNAITNLTKTITDAMLLDLLSLLRLVTKLITRLDRYRILWQKTPPYKWTTT